MLPSAARRIHPTRWLDALSALCAVAAVVLLLLPTPRDVPPNATTTPNADPTDRSAPTVSAVAFAEPRADSLMAVVVNGNVFSATRRAPSSRFVVPGQGLDIPTPPVAYAPPAGGAMRDTAADPLPRLSAIVAMNGERRALLQFVASDVSPRLYRLNDVHAGYRIVRIESDHVVLASRSGTRTLRLSQRATPDTLKNPP